MGYDLPSEWKDLFRRHIKDLKVRGKQALGACPFHEDTRPSFSVNIETSQWLCFAGCGKGNFFDFKRFMEDPSKLVRIGPQNGKGMVKTQAPQVPEKVVATYLYQDERGEPVFEVLRLEPKSFRQRKFGGFNMEGVDRIPYHLYEMHLWKDEVCFWVEGEKDADRLMSLAILASTSNGGANNWTDHLADKIPHEFIVLLPDQNFAGQIYATKVIESFIKRGKTVLCWDPPQIDVSDFLDTNPKVLRTELKNIVWNEGKFFFSKEDPFRFFARKDIPIQSWNEMKSDRLGFLRKQYGIIHDLLPDIQGENIIRIINLIDLHINKTRDGGEYTAFCRLLQYLIIVKEFYAKLY